MYRMCGQRCQGYHHHDVKRWIAVIEAVCKQHVWRWLAAQDMQQKGV